MSPLAGVRVLDLTRLLPGPFCTLYLAQLGADVIKIEDPDGGDYARLMSPELFALINRGKASVTLDLRKQTDAETFRRLAIDADVVIESFRPGVMDKSGCGYAALKAINPRLVYAALTGYGQTGPYRDHAGHDMNFRGYAGELEQTGAGGGAPASGNFQTADLAGGALTCAVGILAALLKARETGEGSFVDVGMLDGTLALQVVALSTLRMLGHGLPRGADALSGAMANYRVYACADGRHLAVAPLEYKFFVRLCRLAGRQDLLELALSPDESGQPLHDALSVLFAGKPRDEWERLLAGEDTCVSAILSLEEALANEHVQARGMIADDAGKPAFRLPIHFDRPLPEVGAAPELGADNARILGAVVMATKVDEETEMRSGAET